MLANGCFEQSVIELSLTVGRRNRIIMAHRFDKITEFEICSASSLVSKGPISSAAGRVTNGVSMACEKCFLPWESSASIKTSDSIVAFGKCEYSVPGGRDLGGLGTWMCHCPRRIVVQGVLDVTHGSPSHGPKSSHSFWKHRSSSVHLPAKSVRCNKGFCSEEDGRKRNRCGFQHSLCNSCSILRGESRPHGIRFLHSAYYDCGDSRLLSAKTRNNNALHQQVLVLKHF